MAPTDFDYLATRNEIITNAFEIVGVMETGQVLTAEQLDQGIRALQLLIKGWTNKHLFLWSFNKNSFSTVIDQEAYDSVLDQAIIGLDKAWIVDSNEDIPLEVVSWSRYQDIYDKETNSGRPCTICYKSTPAPSFYLWPSPDAVYTIKVLCPFALKDFDTENATGDVPARFQEALVYGLADRLFDKYPGSMNERQWIKGKAEEFFAQAKQADVPAETTNEVEGLFRCNRY